MEWKYIKQLESEKLISEFESSVDYKFTDDFKNCVKENNGGRPNIKTFDTDKNNGRAIKSLLSFNKGDRETVWKINEWNKEVLSGKYIAFAVDNFGNLICFDVNNDNVVFIDHETENTELISAGFTSFIAKLYE